MATTCSAGCSSADHTSSPDGACPGRVGRSRLPFVTWTAGAVSPTPHGGPLMIRPATFGGPAIAPRQCGGAHGGVRLPQRCGRRADDRPRPALAAVTRACRARRRTPSELPPHAGFARRHERPRPLHRRPAARSMCAGSSRSIAPGTRFSHLCARDGNAEPAQASRPVISLMRRDGSKPLRQRQFRLAVM